MSRELRPYEPGNAYGIAPGSQVQTIDLRRMMVALRRQRTTILAPALLMGALGLIYVKSLPDTYDAFANLLLDSNQNSAIKQAGGIDTMLTTDMIENARVVLGSDKLAYDVLDQTGLETNPQFLNPPESALSRAVEGVFGTVLAPVSWVKNQVEALVAPADTVVQGTLPTGADPRTGGAAAVDPQRQLAAMKLKAGVQVFRVAKSTAVAVRVTSHDPVIAADIANAYADAYVQDILTSNAESVGRTNAWMQTRLDEQQEQARAAADEAERFASENGLVASSTGALLTEQSLGELNASLSEAISEAARARAVLDTYDKAVAGGVEGLTEGNALSIGGEMSDALVARLDNYNDVRARLEGLINDGGPNHPQVAGLRRTLASTAERLFVELQGQRQEATSALRVAEARVEALQTSVKQATERNTDQAANFVRLRALQERAATLSALYQATLTRAQEIEQQQSFPESNVRILSYAQVPPKASGPSTIRGVLASTLLGLFLGGGLAAIRESRDRFLRTGSDVTDTTGLRFLGHLPVLPRGAPPRAARAGRAEGGTRAAPRRAEAAAHLAHDQQAEHWPDHRPSGETLPAIKKPDVPEIRAFVPVLMYPNSVYAETLRHVRLAAATRDRDMRVTGVTSFHPYAGRSEVSLNLAAQLGLGSDAVLLIDADGRGRVLSRMLRLDRKPGLTDAVSGDGGWHASLFKIADTNIYVLPCGLEGGGASDDLLTSQLLRNVVQDARKSFSAVIVDVPPLYPVAQGRAVLAELQQFVAVGEWGRTPRSMVETTLADHPRLTDKCLGVVYDRVNLRRLRSYLVPEAMENYLSRSKGYLSLKTKKDSSI